MFISRKIFLLRACGRVVVRTSLDCTVCFLILPSQQKGIVFFQTGELCHRFSRTWGGVWWGFFWGGGGVGFVVWFVSF